MKNMKFTIDKQFQAESIAEDLKVQLDVNRFEHVKITPVNGSNEIIIQAPDSSGELETTVESFMKNYKTT